MRVSIYLHERPPMSPTLAAREIYTPHTPCQKSPFVFMDLHKMFSATEQLQSDSDMRSLHEL